MDIEKLLERATEIGLYAPPLSVEEIENAIELIYVSYQKPISTKFLRSILDHTDIKVPHLNNTLHLMKRSGRIEQASRGVYKARASVPNSVTPQAHRIFFEGIRKIGSMKEEITQRESDIEKLQNKVDVLLREKREFRKLSEDV